MYIEAVSLHPSAETRYNIDKKTEINVKWPLKVIQGHVSWGQWKGDEGLNNTI